MVMVHEDGCLCGAIRYRISEPARFSSLCHCRSCRRATGAPVSGFVGVASDQYVETRGERPLYRSSPGVERGFCTACGNSLTYAGSDWPGEIHIYTATLDDPDVTPPAVHTSMADNICWFETSDSLPRLDSFSNKPKN